MVKVSPGGLSPNISSAKCIKIVMMTTTSLEDMSTKELSVRKKFAEIALKLVWSGAAIAIAAVLFRYLLEGVFPATPFFTSIIALLISIPVYQDKKQIALELVQRS